MCYVYILNDNKLPLLRNIHQQQQLFIIISCILRSSVEKNHRNFSADARVVKFSNDDFWPIMNAERKWGGRDGSSTRHAKHSFTQIFTVNVVDKNFLIVLWIKLNPTAHPPHTTDGISLSEYVSIVVNMRRCFPAHLLSSIVRCTLAGPNPLCSLMPLPLPP